MKKENICRIMILILLISLMSPLLQFTGIDIVNTAKAEIFENYQTGWDHHVQFIINHSFIDRELPAFPVLVVLNSTIGSAANGGNSLRFVNENLSELYYHQIDEWNPAGNSYVWVRINNTSSSVDTHVTMFYGNATAPGLNSTNVWDVNYLFVSHMNSTTATVYDMTSNGNDGTKDGAGNPVEAAGQIGQCQDFELATTDKIILGTDISGLGAITVEAWVNRESETARSAIMMSTDNTVLWPDINWRFFLEAATHHSELSFQNCTVSSNTATTTTAGWTYLSAYWEGAPASYIFVNGSLDDAGTGSANMNSDPAAETVLGATKQGAAYTNHFDGMLDELRISNIARSPAWINASYHTGNQTTGFFTWNGGIDSGFVHTNATTSIATTSATFNGDFFLNGSKQTWYGFRYGKTNTALSTNVTVGTDGADRTMFSYAATGLDEGNVYYVQAWANNSKGFSTGVITSFWTDATWANVSLDYRRSITIIAEAIDEDLIDFPVLAIINNTTNTIYDNGNSIRFYKNSTVEYYYDIDEWNHGTTSYVWVNVTHIYDDAGAVFYMYYNDSTATNNESNLTWDGHYLGVYHLNETGGVRVNDSSRYGYNNGTYWGNLPTRNASGKVGYGQILDGDNDYITLPGGCHTPLNGTVEMWETEDRVITCGSASARFYDRGGGAPQYLVSNIQWNTGLYQFYNLAPGFWLDSVVNAYSHNYYNYLNFNWEDGLQKLRINTTTQELDILTPPNYVFTNIYIGVDHTLGSDMNGSLDELRISNIARSDAWLDATYHSINNTTDFFTWGAVEQQPSFEVRTNDVLVVYTQNATINGTLVYASEASTVRFQLNNSSVSYLTGRNTTNQTVTSGQTFYNNTSLPLLNPGDRYYYRAYANDTTNESWGGNRSFLTQPNASSGLSLTQGNLQITLTWTNNDGGDGCYIEVSENYDPGPGWIPGNNTSLGYQITPYQHTGLNNGSMYYYKAWAYAQDGGWRSTVVNTSAPLNQTGLTGNARAIYMLQVFTNNTTGVETTNVTMWGWLNGTGDDTFATVRFQFNNSTGGAVYTPGFWYWNTTNQTLGSRQAFFNSTSQNASLILNPGDRYYYRAYANNTSLEVWGVNLSFLTKSYAQTGFNATASGGAQITLNWTNQLGGDGCYVEYVENMIAADWHSWNPGDYPANGSYRTTPWDHTGLNNSSIYSYKTWAYANDDTWRSAVGNTSAPLNMSALTANATCIGGINVTTNATTGVEEMNATLWGWLNYTGDGSATVRFQYNNTTAFDINTTNQTKNSGDTFSNNTTGLTPGTLYHYRAYGNNTVNNTTGAHMVFLTKPNASTNLVISLVGGDNGFNLTWINNTGCNQTVVMRSTTTYPSSPWDATATEVYNGTNEYFVDDPLTDLQVYYYRIWAYANWTWNGVYYFQFSDPNISDSRRYMAAPIVVFNSTNILLTSATLNLFFDGGGTTYKVGWWVSCVMPTPGSPGLNFTDGVDYTLPQMITYSATGLQPGQYYYVRAWGLSATEFINTTNASRMIMIPNPPTSLQATSVGGDSVQLNWIRFPPPACAGGTTSNRTTVIRYTTSLPYPAGATGANGTATGTWIYNSTLNNYLHSGLVTDTTYYYSMWTYVNDSGSSIIHAWSSSYSTVSAGTEGGNYTITLRYENVSYGRIPTTRGADHKFIVFYADRTEYNFWNDSGNLITTGTYANESDINLTSINPASGTFSFNASSRPLWMEFHWNDTERGNAAEFRCTRIIIPQTGQRNVTFYLRIDLPVFRETVFTINGTLVKYAYSFVDETGFFDTESNALAEIFFYNSTGDRLIVHSEYWDTELKMYPWLVYGKKYFMGVYCDDFNVSNLGIAPSEQNEEPQVVIPFSYTETNNFFEYINLTIEWHDATTLRLTYLDTDYSSTNVTLRLYWWNNTLISTDYYNDLSNFNHFWLLLNNTYSYKIEVITVNGIWPEGLSSGKIPFYGVISLSISNATINTIMETIFGPSPLWVQNIDGTERTVPWSQVIIFGVAFILLVTLGKLNAFLGMSITGGWLIFSSITITGVELYYGGALVTIGLFLIAISILGMLGGVERR